MAFDLQRFCFLRFVFFNKVLHRSSGFTNAVFHFTDSQLVPRPQEVTSRGSGQLAQRVQQLEVVVLDVVVHVVPEVDCR